MKITPILAALLALSLFVPACGGSGEPAPAPIVTNELRALMTGANVVPLVITLNTGEALVRHFPDAAAIDIDILILGIPAATVTGFQIHRGAAGVNGPVIVNLSGGGLLFRNVGAGARAQGAGVLFPGAHAGALLAGECYVNIQTSVTPSGHIRGQLIVLP
jgi:hypothetical protein